MPRVSANDRHKAEAAAIRAMRRGGDAARAAGVSLRTMQRWLKDRTNFAVRAAEARTLAEAEAAARLKRDRIANPGAL